MYKYDDDIIDFADFADFSSYWQLNDCTNPGWCMRADLNMKGYVNIED